MNSYVSKNMNHAKANASTYANPNALTDLSEKFQNELQEFKQNSTLVITQTRHFDLLFSEC